MVEPQASRFWEAAVKSGLLDERTLRAAWEAIPAEKRTADAADRRLARQIVNAGRLTLWQAQQILAGRWQGLRINKYELQDILGVGGMGRVYLARDSRLGRKVALKILSRERMNNNRALARFRREAKVGAQLQHENLVRIYDEGEAHGVRYLVMEFIEGKTVGQLIADLGRLHPATAANIARQVALGLEHLHQKGLLHRDVNPMNILVDRDGTAKVTDLGLAIDLGDMEDIVTRDGATVGTFDYISPEQAKHSRSVDARSDIYSLGCTLYHMISGHVPFPSPSLPEKLYAHQLSEPEPLSEQVPGVPEGLVAVVAKMMKKSVDDRYRRAADAARALEPFSSGSWSPEQISTPTSTMNEVAAQPPSGATPPGSDPDLELKAGATAVTAPITPQSDPMDVFRVNLGPETPLSEISSSARKAKAKRKSSTSGTAELEQAATEVPRKRVSIPIRPLLIGLAGLAGLALLAAVLFVAWKNFPTRTKASGGTTESPPVINQPPGTPPEIVVRFLDGKESAQPDLREAIRRVAGRSGDIIVRSKATLRVGDPKTPLRLTGGHMRILAADGARPVLAVDLSAGVPWLQVDPQAKLTMTGLTIRAEVVPVPGAKPGASPPTLIASSGNVDLRQCLFTTSSAERSIRAVVCDGLELRAAGCLFEGFNRPVTAGLFPGANARFSQCLFVRDVAADPLAGWAITAIRKNAPRSTQPRGLTVDHCTAIGAGFLDAEGFAPDGPLAVTVTGCAMRTSALLMSDATKDALPKSLVWTGKENAYQITGAAWVLVPPTGFDSLKDGPVDLKGWAELMKGDSAGSDDPIKFSGPKQTEGQIPDQFAAIVGGGKPPVGVDPAKVGPGGKP